ncbi:MAG: PDZ domain-containing protein [Planctomycetota bacterium]
MKITTQRTLLWLGNFMVAASLILLVVLFAKSASRKAIAKSRRATLVEVNEGLDAIESLGDQDGGPGKTGARLKVVKKADFYYMGYVAPEIVDTTKGKPKPPAKAPALDTLISLTYLVAPIRDNSGPFEIIDLGKAAVKIKNIAGNVHTFPYQEGDIIGTGEGDFSDEDAALKEHGGAKILKIDGDGIVCLWAKEEVRVDILRRDDPQGLNIQGTDGKFVVGGKDSGKGGKSGSKPEGAIASNVKLFELKKSRGVQDVVALTKDGWDTLNKDGDRILDGVTFEKAKDNKGKNALKVSKIPSQLKGYGLQDGDIITRIDGKAVTSKETIARHVRKTYKNKSSYRVTILRNGRQRYINVSVPRTLRGKANLRKRFGNR